MPCALIDANVLVGYIDSDDILHERAVSALKQARGSLMTTWAAAAEAAYLLGRRGWEFQECLLDMIIDEELLIAPLGREDSPRLKALMSKYRDRPMDLADATLLRVAERDGINTILTLDSDFRVYRAAGIGALKILPKP